MMNEMMRRYGAFEVKRDQYKLYEESGFKTPSGKIEIFSSELHAFGDPERVPAVPKYLEEWESPFGAEAEKYPLQAVGSHSLARVHSTHDNNPWLREAFPQRVFLNPLEDAPRVDAAAVFGRPLPSAFARRHPFSHGLGQIRPRMAGSAMSRFTVTTASPNCWPPICRMGNSMTRAPC